MQMNTPSLLAVDESSFLLPNAVPPLLNVQSVRETASMCDKSDEKPRVPAASATPVVSL